MVADPSLLLKHFGLVKLMLLASGAGSVIVAAAEATHPLASVAVTVYVPAARLVAIGPGCELLQV
jgi:pimeloyl-ACP methyl ester carboxylesterase